MGFLFRYPPHGRRAVAIENGVPWERLRAPPIETPAHDLHMSDCLNELQPGDHIEIQWRRNKEFPYGLLFVQLPFQIILNPITAHLSNLEFLLVCYFRKKLED